MAGTTDYIDPNSTWANGWTQIGQAGQIVFSTFNFDGYQGTRSFAVHVELVDHPETEMVLEAEILEALNSTLIQRVDYSYDVFNQLVRRQLDDDGPDGPYQPTDTFYSWEGGQVALQFDGTEASNLSHRYVWNPAAVDQLLTDEQISSPGMPGDVLWPLADQLGTIRDLASHDSVYHTTTVDNHRIYDSFGNLITQYDAAVDELFGFTGRQFGQEKGISPIIDRRSSGR